VSNVSLIDNMPTVFDSSARQRSCFVISPIGDHDSDVRRHADAVFRYIIEPATRECGIVAYRSDHLRQPGRISEEMYDRILNDDICIALLTGRNPNVYYEVAIAHSAGRPVITLLHRDEEAPFDIKDFRFISYDFLPDRLIEEKLYAKELVQHIRSIEETGWKVAYHIPGMARATRWQSMITRCGHKMRAYKVRAGMLFQQATLNERRLLCAPYMTSRTPNEAPAIVTTAGSPIYKAIRHELKVLKERNCGAMAV
jgi:hypothetical protein